MPWLFLFEFGGTQGLSWLRFIFHDTVGRSCYRPPQDRCHVLSPSTCSCITMFHFSFWRCTCNFLHCHGYCRRTWFIPAVSVRNLDSSLALRAEFVISRQLGFTDLPSAARSIVLTPNAELGSLIAAVSGRAERPYAIAFCRETSGGRTALVGAWFVVGVNRVLVLERLSCRNRFIALVRPRLFRFLRSSSALGWTHTNFQARTSTRKG